MIDPGLCYYFAAWEATTTSRSASWSGLMAGVGALAAIAANRVATSIWRRVFDEEPPD